MNFMQKVLRWQRDSVIFDAGRRVRRWILQTDVASVGIFWMTFGVASLAVEWVRFAKGGNAVGTILPVLILLTAAVPLGMHKSLWQATEESLLFGWLIRDVGELWIPDPFFDKTPHRHPVAATLLGGIAGAVGAVWSPLTVVAAVPIIVLLMLFSAIPELALLALLLILPLLNLLPHGGLALVACVAVCDLTCAGKVISGKRQLSFTDTDKAAFGLGMLYLAGGIITNGRPVDGLMRGGLLLSAWFCGRLLLTGIWKKRAEGVLILSAVISSIYGIFQYVTGRAELKWVDASRFGDIGGRVCGWFQNPNVFAVFLLLTVPLSLGRCFGKGRIPWRVCGLFAFACGCVCLILTWSRGAWLGMLLATVLFLTLCSRQTRRLLCLLPVVAFLTIPVLPSGVVNRFQSIGNLADSSANYRVQTWIGTLRLIGARPWGIGVGEAAFHRVFPIYAVSGTERVPHPHNAFFEIFVEIGVIGLLLLLFILFRILSDLFRGLHAPSDAMEPIPSPRSHIAARVSLLAAVLLMGFFDSLWYHSSLFWLFWLILSIQNAERRTQNAECRMKSCGYEPIAKFKQTSWRNQGGGP